MKESDAFQGKDSGKIISMDFVGGYQTTKKGQDYFFLLLISSAICAVSCLVERP
jgi:hypothetical protein